VTSLSGFLRLIAHHLSGRQHLPSGSKMQHLSAPRCRPHVIVELGLENANGENSMVKALAPAFR
jgi:hypothetical protein